MGSTGEREEGRNPGSDVLIGEPGIEDCGLQSALPPFLQLDIITGGHNGK